MWLLPPSPFPRFSVAPRGGYIRMTFFPGTPKEES